MCPRVVGGLYHTCRLSIICVPLLPGLASCRPCLQARAASKDPVSDLTAAPLLALFVSPELPSALFFHPFICLSIQPTNLVEP